METPRPPPIPPLVPFVPFRQDVDKTIEDLRKALEWSPQRVAVAADQVQRSRTVTTGRLRSRTLCVSEMIGMVFAMTCG